MNPGNKIFYAMGAIDINCVGLQSCNMQKLEFNNDCKIDMGTLQRIVSGLKSESTWIGLERKLYWKLQGQVNWIIKKKKEIYTDMGEIAWNLCHQLWSNSSCEVEYEPRYLKWKKKMENINE